MESQNAVTSACSMKPFRHNWVMTGKKAVSLAVRRSLVHGESKRGWNRSEASRTVWKEMRRASSVKFLLKER